MAAPTRLQAANTFLLLVVGAIAVLNGSTLGDIEAPLRFTVYAVGVLVALVAIGEIWSDTGQ